MALSCGVTQFAHVLRAHRGGVGRSAQCRSNPLVWAPPFERTVPLYPRGPRSGPGYAVLVHLRLGDPIRPTRGHVAISLPCSLYATPSLCVPASATHERFRAFAPQSFSACHPLRPRGIRRLLVPSSFADSPGLHRDSNGSALPR